MDYTADQIKVLDLVTEELTEQIEKDAEEEAIFSAYEHNLNIGW